MSDKAKYAGIIYQFMGFLTTRDTRLTLSASDDAAPAVGTVEEFLKKHGLDDVDPDFEWNVPLSPPDCKGGKDVGLFQKYIVDRVDGKPMPDGCIVLEWKDPYARDSIKDFAFTCRRRGYEPLYQDLMAKYKELTQRDIDARDEKPQ